MKFPKRIKHRGRALATIYGKSKGRDSYRVAWQVAGQRRMASFASYSLAKRHADGLVKDLAKGSQVTALHPAQARDALAALERLTDFYQKTGRRVSLLAGISEFVEASAKLNGRTMGEAIEGYLRTVANVKRKDIMEAVTDFLQADATRTEAAEGQRSQLSAKYAYNRKLQLNRFAAAFPNTAVCDLTKEHVDAFIGSLDTVKTTSRNGRAANSAKSRNHYRASIRQFLQWAIRKDYLAPTHRLNEADAMRSERANNADVEFYTPEEFAALLAAAKDTAFQPIIAIGGLAGLRTAELLRLDWADVWRVPGHIEITAVGALLNQFRVADFHIVWITLCCIPAMQAVIQNPRHIANVRDAENQSVFWFERTHDTFLFGCAGFHQFNFSRGEGVKVEQLRYFGKVFTLASCSDVSRILPQNTEGFSASAGLDSSCSASGWILAASRFWASSAWRCAANRSYGEP